MVGFIRKGAYIYFVLFVDLGLHFCGHIMETTVCPFAKAFDEIALLDYTPFHCYVITVS